MKRLFLIFIIILAFTSIAFADTFNLKATWIPNIDAVTIGYNLYRTDGTRIKINSSVISGKSTSSYLFSITVPPGSYGTATFVVTATSATKESVDSNTATFPFDLTPVPQTVAGVGVMQQ